MLVETLLSVIVGGVAASFSGFLGYRYVRRQRLYHLLWGIGLGLWALSAFAQGYAFAVGWTVGLYKAYYVSAISLAGFMGAGTLGLILKRPRPFLGFVAYILAVSLLLGVAVGLAPVDESVLANAAVGGTALPSGVRLLSPLINVPGGIAFIGGAFYTLWRTRKPFALLIGIGALTPAVGGILARFGMPYVLPFTDFAGVVFLSAGIYLSLKAWPVPHEDSARAAA